MNRGVAAAAIVGGIVLSAGRVSPLPTAAAVAAAPRHAAANPLTVAAEHRYRVFGRVRLALFWTRGSLVGSARMSARHFDDSRELTFLLGSDPARAPRGLNQWSYVREETRGEQGAAFALRSLSADDAIDRVLPTAPDRLLFGASCAFVQGGGIRSLITTVNGDGLTYRMFDRVLDNVAHASRWDERQLPRRAGVAAGLLSAMDQMIRRSAVQPAVLRTLQPVPYVYDGTLYDLSVRGAHDAGPAQIGASRFEWLTRIDFAIFNRRTGEVSRFSATFVPGTAALPVQIVFQPNFWLRVELRLADDADVPLDPAANHLTLSRIRDICSDAAGGAGQTATSGRTPSAARN